MAEGSDIRAGGDTSPETATTSPRSAVSRFHQITTPGVTGKAVVGLAELDFLIVARDG